MAENEIVWWEIETGDKAGARRFYTELFGWSVESAMGDYEVLKRGGESIGGLVPSSDGNPRTVLFVQVSDLEAALTRAESLGGSTVTPRTEITDKDWYAVVRDPSGHKIGLWTDQPAK